MSTDEASNHESTCNGTESRCALCHEHLKGRHTHPELWACDLQQFLLRYTAIPLGSCVCRADQVSIKKGLGLAGKHKDEFIPRWIKRELQKQKSSCCVPGCGMVAECTCVFASFDTICAATSVNTDESSTVADTNSFHSVSNITTLCISTVIVKVLLTVLCVVASVSTVPAVTYAGHSDLSPSLKVSLFCCKR